ncbi:TPA: hypothetical protein ACVU4L_002030 [Vibrio parahaemolyticus]
MLNRLNQYLSEKFYSTFKLTNSSLFHGLRPIEKNDGKSCTLVCPSCWSNDAFHYFGTGSISCNNCHEHTSLVSALGMLNECTEIDAAKNLLQSSCLALPPAIFGAGGEKGTSADKASDKHATVTTRWLLEQLKLWLKANEEAVESLVMSGWDKELLFKAPLGYLPSGSAIQSVVRERLPISLYKSARAVNKGIVVPWVLPNNDVFLWGYRDSLQLGEPVNEKSIRPPTPCHMNHPINIKSDWLVVVADPILASLLLAKRIPACAIGDSTLSEFSCKGLKGVNKTIYIVAEKESMTVSHVLAHVPNAHVVDEVKPIAFGPYHGAYYRRFNKWPVSRFKKVEPVYPTPALSNEQIIAMLSTLIDNEMSFVEAVDVLKIKTGKTVEITPIKR